MLTPDLPLKSTEGCLGSALFELARLLLNAKRHASVLSNPHSDSLLAGFASAQPRSSNRACVTGALEKDRHAFQHRFDPPLLCSSHSSVKRFSFVGKQAGASIPTCSTENGGAKFRKQLNGGQIVRKPLRPSEQFPDSTLNGFKS